MRNTVIAAHTFYERLVSLLREIVRHEPSGQFEFSRYVNGPPGTAGTRTFTYIQGGKISVTWICNAIKQLSGNEELALNSRYYVKDCLFHIPMIDFTTGEFQEIQLHKIQRIAGNFGASWFIASSGNSFHAYFSTLLKEAEWHAYLGELLLQTPPVYEGKPMPIDIRWVGHSLINGFSALRCSGRTPRYKYSPRFVIDSEAAKDTDISSEDYLRLHMNDSP